MATTKKPKMGTVAKGAISNAAQKPASAIKSVAKAASKTAAKAPQSTAKTLSVKQKMNAPRKQVPGLAEDQHKMYKHTDSYASHVREDSVHEGGKRYQMQQNSRARAVANVKGAASKKNASATKRRTIK